MSLDAGTKLGPYEILAPIGAGGMGEVYKARDTRLDRIVALKICAEQFNERFDREARAISSLNHPHICQLYDVGPNYLVMEYIEGQPLRGPLPVDKAAVYAGQILSALDTAHRQGIVHRDLKPANILVTKAGVKLLDFGLAKMQTSVAAGVNAEKTVTMALTTEHTIVGTPQYMAPEQIEGKPQDERTDIFAFGCVFYEMLTGKRAFAGKSASSVMAAILATEPPPVSQVEGTNPPELDRVVSRCLAKDPEERWRSAGDLRAALELALGPRTASSSARLGWLPKAAVASGLAAVALVLAWAAGYLRRPENEIRPYRLQVAPPPGARLVLGATGGVAVSPDGRTLALVAENDRAPKLWIRPIDGAQTREVPGTDGASYPFWSPNGRSVAFFAGGKLKVVEAAGGSPLTICDAPNPRGGSWNQAGLIIFAPQAVAALMSVPATGGTASILTQLDVSHAESTHRWPQFLPDGRRFLYFVRSSDPRRMGAYLGSLGNPNEKTLLVNSSTNALYLRGRHNDTGYVLWLRDDSLTVQPFDASRGVLAGEPGPLPGGDRVALWAAGHRAQVWGSGPDTLAYASGSSRYQLAWLSRDGRILSRIGQPDFYNAIRLSPDGRQVAAAVPDAEGILDLWKIDVARGVRTRLTFGSHGYVAVWSPDSQRIASHGPASTGFRMFIRDASGAGKEEDVTPPGADAYVSDWSPDGRFLAHSEIPSQGSYDIWVLENPLGAAGVRKASVFLKTSFREYQARFSPDGKWIAYTSDESGREEIYIQRFPSDGAKWMVSSGGGAYPVWPRNGKELFYQAPDGRLMAIPVRFTATAPELGVPTALMRVAASAGIMQYLYDVSPDGQQILTVVADDKGDQPLLTVIGNWEVGLRAPAR